MVLENNPYEGKFDNEHLQRLATYLDMGCTSDAAQLGLLSKFHLEACQEYLLKTCGMVMIGVSRESCIESSVEPYIRFLKCNTIITVGIMP